MSIPLQPQTCAMQITEQSPYPSSSKGHAGSFLSAGLHLSMPCSHYEDVGGGCFVASCLCQVARRQSNARGSLHQAWLPVPRAN